MNHDTHLLSATFCLLAFAACGDPAETLPGDTNPTAGTAGRAATGGSGMTAGTGGSAGSAVGSGGSSGAQAGRGGGGSGLGGSTSGSAGMAAGKGGTMAMMGGAGPMGGSAGAGAGPEGGGAPMGGTGTAAGTGGMPSGGTGSSTTCPVDSKSTQSTAIPTVHTVTFTTTLTGITKAEIEFGPAAGGGTMVAPVDLMAPMYQTYLVGMKPSAMYVYRVKLTSAAGTCVGPDQMITTGALMNAPKPTVTISDMAKHDKGFIVVSSGIGGTAAYILDPDGTTVWVAPSGQVPTQPSRAHLSWDAKRFITMSLNVMNTSAGKIQSVAMDGTDAKSVSGAQASHHDFTAIPGGIATLMWNSSGIDAPCSLVEFPDSGASKTIVADMKTIYKSNSYHTNAIHYYERDDSYTVGDRNPNAFAKLTRAGALVWQFGGSSPVDAAKNFSGVTSWSVNHGHHLSKDNNFTFFNNGTGNSSAVFVYKLDTATMAATQTAKLTGTNSQVLGDTQFLPNGNILISGSTTGTLTEVTSSGTTVMTIKAPSGQQFGYSEFRESLYGKPPYD